MLQVLNDVMKMELIADKQCDEIKQVRFSCVHVFACSTVLCCFLPVTYVLFACSHLRSYQHYNKHNCLYFNILLYISIESKFGNRLGYFSYFVCVTSNKHK
jgi:hypothetical protein